MIFAMYFTHLKTLIPVKRVKTVKMHHLIDLNLILYSTDKITKAFHCKSELGFPVDYRHYKK